MRPPVVVRCPERTPQPRPSRASRAWLETWQRRSSSTTTAPSTCTSRLPRTASPSRAGSS
ncbi:hypothetical protein [Frondihabitans sp. 762G35]|uniref:hypothetical protein n=1 Tax=Frondihabitans sp. 762G35 TaxID=1446794 RepID=UPI003FA42DBD